MNIGYWKQATAQEVDSTSSKNLSLISVYTHYVVIIPDTRTQIKFKSFECDPTSYMNCLFTYQEQLQLKKV